MTPQLNNIIMIYIYSILLILLIISLSNININAKKAYLQEKRENIDRYKTIDYIVYIDSKNLINLKLSITLAPIPFSKNYYKNESAQKTMVQRNKYVLQFWIISLIIVILVVLQSIFDRA